MWSILTSGGFKKMGKPTENELREFWEWCGFKFEESYPGVQWGLYKVTYPDGHYTLPVHTNDELPIDLNNLFKYAVPKLLIAKGKSNLVYGLFRDWTYDWVMYEKKPALDLFWAIWEAIHNER
jgi:hypothetical protein